MSSVFLSPEVFIELFLEGLLLVLLGYTFLTSVNILRLYKEGEISDSQLYLEKKTYLITSLVQASLVLKLILVVFFVYALDELSDVIPGAMCVTGVLDANDYGSVLLVIKLFVLLLSALWLVLKKEAFKKRIIFFLLLYVFIVFEFIVSLFYFSNISVETVVSCCSSKYKHFENMIPFGISKQELLALFYTLYILVFLSTYFQLKKALFVSSSLFVVISYYAIVYYFGAFFYGNSTHICPFCILKEEYYYIGYALYSLLFLGVFYSFTYILFPYKKNARMLILTIFSLFVFILSSYLLVNVV